MWCPKCKNEYIDGITQCADCGCALVDDLNAVETVLKEDIITADALSEEEIDELHKMVKTGVYQKPAEKAEDFKSSAYVLIGVGSIGLVVLALLLLGKLPIQLVGTNRYFIGGVLGAMLILFIVMGIQSFRSSNILRKKAGEEDALTKEILNWCRNNLTSLTIDDTKIDDIPEEAKYFKRTEKMTEQITKQFINLDENYVEQLVDEFYQEVYATK